MLGSSFHDNLPHRGVACVENVIEPLLQELCGLRNTTIKNCIQVLEERETDSCTVELILRPHVSNSSTLISSSQENQKIKISCEGQIRRWPKTEGGDGFEPSTYTSLRVQYFLPELGNESTKESKELDSTGEMCKMRGGDGEVLSLLFRCVLHSAGDPTQGLVHIRSAFYLLSCISSPAVHVLISMFSLCPVQSTAGLRPRYLSPYLPNEQDPEHHS